MKSICLILLFFCFLGFDAIGSSDIYVLDRFVTHKSDTVREWEKVAREAAESYEMSYETFIEKANQFLINYKREHPGTNYPLSVEDLMIYKKPDYSDILKEIEKLNEEKPENEKIDITSFIVPVPMFSVPLGY